MTDVYQTPSVAEYASMKYEERQKVAELIDLNKNTLNEALDAAREKRSQMIAHAKAEAKVEGAILRQRILNEARRKLYAEAEVFPVHPDWLKHRREANEEMKDYDRRNRGRRPAAPARDSHLQAVDAA